MQDLSERCDTLIVQIEPGSRFHDRVLAVLTEQRAEIARLTADLAALREAVGELPEYTHSPYCYTPTGCTGCACAADAANAVRANARKLAGLTE